MTERRYPRTLLYIAAVVTFILILQITDVVV